MKTAQILLIEALLGPVRELTRMSQNPELACLAAKREICLLEELVTAYELVTEGAGKPAMSA